jgi:hypothetical protein
MLLANSTLAFLVAASVTILLHETSHAVAGITLGAQAIQSPFAVGYRPALTSSQQVITALTGPIFSLVSGLGGHAVPALPRFLDAGVGWFGVLGAEEGFRLLHDRGRHQGPGHRHRVGPPGCTDMDWLCFAVGIGGLFLLAWRFSRFVVTVSRDVADERVI